MEQKKNRSAAWREFWWINAGVLLVSCGVYFFKFPNHFSTGGVSGLSLLFAALLPSDWLTPGTMVVILNVLLLVVGFAVLGRSFGIKTTYASLMFSAETWLLERLLPMTEPLTDQPLLELFFAMLLPAIGSAMLFNTGASTGGTDVVAMILKKYSTLDTGKALLVSDSLIALSACFIFDIRTGLFSLFGLMLKAFLEDSVIESINLCKYFTIVTTRPQEICDYIMHTIGHSATLVKATGAFSCEEKMLVLTAVKRGEAVHLRQRIREIDPGAFMFIANTSEILGKGFRSSL